MKKKGTKPVTITTEATLTCAGCPYHMTLFVVLVAEAEAGPVGLFSWTYGSSHSPSSSFVS